MSCAPRQIPRTVTPPDIASAMNLFSAGSQGWIGVIVDAHGPAHDDEPVKVVGFREPGILVQTGHRDARVVLHQPRLDAAQALERGVLEPVDPCAACAAAVMDHAASSLLRKTRDLRCRL